MIYPLSQLVSEIMSRPIRFKCYVLTLEPVALQSSLHQLFILLHLWRWSAEVCITWVNQNVRHKVGPWLGRLSVLHRGREKTKGSKVYWKLLTVGS